MDEHPNEGLIARHQHDIAPLLKNRKLFAESANFVLYDFWTDHGTVDENVFAYSNRWHDQRAIIFYNNRYGNTRGTIHISAASMEKAGGSLRQRSLTEGLALPVEDSVILAFRDMARGLEYLRRSTDLDRTGLSLELRGFQYMVLLDWRELRSSADQPWDTLCDSLGGRGVHSVDEALTKLRLRPLHEALRHAISPGNVHLFAEIAGEPARKGVKEKSEEPRTVAAAGKDNGSVKRKEPPEEQASDITSDIPGPCVSLDVVDPRLGGFIENCQRCFERAVEYLPGEIGQAAESQTPVLADPKVGYKNVCEAMTVAALRLPCMERIFSTAWPPAVRDMLPSNEPGVHLQQTWAPVLAWVVLRSLPTPNIRAALFDKLQMRSALADIFSSMGMEGENTWRAAARVRILLWQEDTPSATINTEEFWVDPDVQWLAGVNQASGKTYFNKEQFEELLSWLQLPALLEIAQQEADESRSIGELEDAVSSTCRAAEDAGYELGTFVRQLRCEPSETLISSSKPVAEVARKS